MKFLASICFGILVWSPAANAANLLVEVTIYKPDATAPPSTEALRVFVVPATDGNHLIDMERLIQKESASTSQTIMKCYKAGLPDGVYYVVVRDEPTLVMRYIFAKKKTDYLQSNKDNLVKIELHANTLQVMPTINGARIYPTKEMGDTSYSLSLKGGALEQEQDVPILVRNGQEFCPLFYFVSRDKYSLTLTAGNRTSGDIVRKPRSHTLSMDFATGVPKVLKVDFPPLER